MCVGEHLPVECDGLTSPGKNPVRVREVLRDLPPGFGAGAEGIFTGGVGTARGGNYLARRFIAHCMFRRIVAFKRSVTVVVAFASTQLNIYKKRVSQFFLRSQ